ncbi:MAG: porin [Hyphomicrobium sp.]|nr:porin [Hyphomicrobium sp.]
MNKYSLSALVAAGLLAGAATSASAADLGGNCCADLEERIAELEATTARKGNRKVSLTVSGWVNQQITFWDDGAESNVYIHDLGTTLGSHVKFTGQATISPGWSAGYVLHIEAINSDGLTISQNNDNGPAAYVGSRRADGTTFGNWGGAQGCAGMGGAWGDCNGLTRNVVRYDSPSFGGFSVSASWGEDDMWDVAARYAGEFSGFKLAAAAAYNEVTDAGMGAAPVSSNNYFQAGAYLQHVPTGLFVLGNYGILDVDGAAEKADTWYVKAGLRTRMSALGHTVFYGEYLNGQDGGFNADSELDVWGAGIVQEIDAAAMSVWLKYRNLSYDDAVETNVEDFQYVGLGAIINF